mmetsp:Transcript_160839/g.516226  ORF Transcript_160839/g.516226 Transcript_160839/m.516226 type:complete len:528 (-) Transcript_160839:198-1781(-)
MSFRSPRPAAVPKEVRIDPEDSQPRTFEELRVLCKDKYSETEIQEYWDMTMIRHVGEGIHNVAADPFLTHASRNPVAAERSNSLPRQPPTASAPAASLPPSATRGTALGSEASLDDGLANVLKDPFMAAEKYMAVADMRQDPFITYGETNQPSGDGETHVSRRQQLTEAVSIAHKTFDESLHNLLGPGDPDREIKTRTMIVLGPWLLFMWILMLWLVLIHYSRPATVVLTCLVGLASLGMLFVWYQGRRGGPVSLLVAGLLGLAAVGGGVFAGQNGYSTFWRQYWWTQTGFRGGITTASTPAMARTDFAVLTFWDDKAGTTYNQTRVDPMRAAGYKDTDFYCVAPILSPDIAGASLLRVNYWAVGINCCQRAGRFTCDDSREWNAGYGVVMLDGGYPCPDCNTEQFRKAVIKAEAMHGLVSASGAKFVRFVKDPSSIETGMLLHCIGFVLLCALLGGMAFGAAGWLAWYYGFGICGPHGAALADSLAGAVAAGKVANAGINSGTPLTLQPGNGEILSASTLMVAKRR